MVSELCILREKSGSAVRQVCEILKLGGSRRICFPLVSPGVLVGKGRLTSSSMVPHGWI